MKKTQAAVINEGERAGPLPPLFRQCLLAGCDKTFPTPPSAENKKFCCSAHRLEWHKQRAQKARDLLRAQEQGEGANNA